MEFRSNNNSKKQAASNSFSEKKNKSGLLSLFEEAMDSQLFYNSRMVVLDRIAKLGNLKTAMLTITIEPTKSGFLNRILDSHIVNFDLVYVTDDGKAYQTKGLYNEELPGEAGLIPKYVIDGLKESPSYEIRMNAEDLSILYEEKDTPVDEASSFREIIETAKENGVAVIKLIDRVFYTRIECMDSEGATVGEMHIGVITDIPDKYSAKLYPGQQISLEIK